MDAGDLGPQVAEAIDRCRSARRAGDGPAARRWAERALEASGGELPERAQALAMLAQVARDEGRLDDARARYRQALADNPGHRVGMRAYLLRHLGDLEREAGEASAEPLLEEALALYRELPANDASLANAIRPLALLRETQGRMEQARRLWEEARRRYDAAGIRSGIEECDARLKRGEVR